MQASAPIDSIRLNWSDGSGSDRELMARILSDRADLVSVDSTDSNTPGRLEKLGFPVSMAEGRQRWTSPEVEPGNDTTVALGNTALMRELASRGYQPGEVVHSCLLSPFLSFSRWPVLEREFEVSDADISSYGRQSGDLNPLHFEDSFAASLGFKGRIAHGMIFNGWLTKFLGTDYPGPGTIFLRCMSIFLAPVYPGETYGVRISTPFHDETRNTYRIVAQLFDPAGKHCLIAYSDVMHRKPPGGS